MAEIGANVKLGRGKVNTSTGLHWLPSYDQKSTKTPHRINQAVARWQQTVGRIIQVADCGDGDEDEDEEEIPSYVVLLTASVERFDVYQMRNLFLS